MTVPTLAAVDFGGPVDGPLILLGPSLGTSAATLWGGVADGLVTRARLVGWDLPGHGRSAPAAAFTIADLAAAVLALADQLGAQTFHYAGDSVGGAVGLQVALDAPHRMSTATLMCTGAVIGTPDGWHERAATVRADGIAPIVAAAPQRWFAPGFVERHPGVAAALLDSLSRTDPQSYAWTCEALAGFDVARRLTEIAIPVLAVAGRDDVPTPPESLQRIATGVSNGELVVLDGVAHLAPAEAPDRVAALIAQNVGLSPAPAAGTVDDVYRAGMAVRREVLGDAHVDRATAATTDLTADFQRMITEYAWGGIWTRPGLDRRSRSMITLTALIARGHHEEFAMHLRAARRNGLTDDEIKELIMQTAIYCGVPDANSAFRIAADVLSDDDAAGGAR
ncbi:bifunctional 3-oxoadipate enol-lactonase/4-carboxymuconolactone decarboxylase PcaDC [Mycolicibacterium parafortuitum]|uniref:4-carboxymuconolactone decarboxylase [Nocardioides sp. JS614] n=1 Tax=Mycolicibacterium parafortuitum TaxID=39692 RepID=A0A375YI15_MYCPF|nr:4-carboxymuconolactone decarboxylase [Mycolicibacterium parafortuitum]ORB30530.1 4-carboxymuconolactone decarboxylase [Mycolicibacterium parafortuitum]SRX80748.1 4-carboxymuconolactone decarboxylase [Nocardioides sp. JS614] [Mycolicibacterium parafortuitum]